MANKLIASSVRVTYQPRLLKDIKNPQESDWILMSEVDDVVGLGESADFYDSYEDALKAAREFDCGFRPVPDDFVMQDNIVIAKITEKVEYYK